MHFIQPKPYIDRLRLRNHAQGVERRRNLSKIILEKGTPFPKPVTYEDIDKAFYEWVDKKLEVVYNGKKLPTYKLFSNQKLSEYSQTWKNLDDTGNIIMNFKTITRENNPQHGESQGGNYNVPVNRNYPMFAVPVLQENGDEAYDLYSMKQPLSINFMYAVSVICNKYEILNKFNELIHYEFSSLECYISPNGHPMPMIIESINDESEYSIDDRKYYAQSYQIKLMGYIIRKEDFTVTKIPSRYSTNIIVDESKKYKKPKNDECWLDKLDVSMFISSHKKSSIADTELPKLETIDAVTDCETRQDNGDVLPPPRPSVVVEEDCCKPKEENPYVHKIMKLIVDFPYCEEYSIKFTVDSVIDIDTIETRNIYDFVVRINDKVETFEDEVTLKVGDEVSIDITKKDDYGDARIVIKGTDPDTVIDTRIEYESALDEPPTEEDIYVTKKGTE